jgi:hypothetical protein
MKLMTGTVRRWDSGAIAAIARVVPSVIPGDGYPREDANRGEEAYLLNFLYDAGDTPDAECLVIIDDDQAELQRIREMLEGVGDE